jgi:SAM-dependent methyltransferase
MFPSPSSHAILDALVATGVSSVDGFTPYYPRTRDRDDVRVLRCRQSEVLVLDRIDHIGQSHYTALDSKAYWNTHDRATALLSTRMDDRRRAEQFEALVRGRRWVDVGSGMGGVLDGLRDTARSILAVEPQPGARAQLEQAGHAAVESIEGVPDDSADVVTLFHVFEHLPNPIEVLGLLRKKLAKDGSLLIEVPHARDALLVRYQCEAFKAFTFWSEHLILHTRQSLGAFLAAGGFDCVWIQGFQRYSLANHLHWLSLGKPGGHDRWAELASPELDASYARSLAALDQTDTIIALAKPRG